MSPLRADSENTFYEGTHRPRSDLTLDRTDYQKNGKKMFTTILRKPNIMNIASRNIFKLCQKDPRNHDENILIAYYLINKIGYFSYKLERILMPNLAAKLKSKEYKAGETIIKTGEEGDCMFIMFKGIADVLIKVILIFYIFYRQRNHQGFLKNPFLITQKSQQ